LAHLREAELARGAQGVVLDLSDYEMTSGRAKTGSTYVTFRSPGRQTVTAFGAAASAMRGMHERGEDATVRMAGGGRRAVIAASVDCPVTGLRITEAGREPPRFEEGRVATTLPAVIDSAEPKGFWARTRETVREWLGIRDEIPVPEQIVEKVAPGSTGYPRVDIVVDGIREQLRDRPDLADDNGARFDALADKHLPRIVRTHAASVDGARPDEIARLDAMLVESVSIVTTSLARAVERTQNDESRLRVDSMTTELGFMKARHGINDAPQLTALPEPTLALPADRPRIRSGAKGPASEDEVVLAVARRATESRGR
jgi:hypothetical protein